MQSWLSGISWSDYFSTIGWIAGGYYAFILSVYYRRDLLKLVTGKQAAGSSGRAAKPAVGAVRPGLPETDLHRVHDLMEELKPVFSNKESLLGKADLLARVQTRLHGYTPLIGSDFEDAVIHHIILESNERCGIALHAEEIKAVWSDR